MIKMEKRKSFVFFLDWHRVLVKYDRELRCRVYDAIIAYAESGEEPELEGEARMAFSFIREDIDRNQAKYEAICARRREWGRRGAKVTNDAARKRNEDEAENTKSGISRHKPTQADTSRHKAASASISKHKVANAAENENVNVNDNVNENVNLSNEILNSNSLTQSLTARTRAKKNLKDKEKEASGETDAAKRSKGKGAGAKFLGIAPAPGNPDKIVTPAEFLRVAFNGLSGRVEFEERILKKSFDTIPNARAIARKVVEDWESRPEPPHKTLDDAYDHLIKQMRIQRNVERRKARLSTEAEADAAKEAARQASAKLKGASGAQKAATRAAKEVTAADRKRPAPVTGKDFSGGF